MTESVPLRPLVIVTGASRGLGKSLCAQSRAKGAEVVEFSRSAPYPFSVAVDLSRPDEAQRIVAARLQELASRRWSEILVVHNAGSLDPIGPAKRKRTAALLANMNANFVSGILFLTQAQVAFEAHASRKLLVNISSGAALKGYAGWSLYCAAKAGLENYVRAVAAEQKGAEHPWLALNVDPDVMDTAMQEAIRAASEEDFPDVARFVDRKESGALRAPSDVAEIVLRIAATATEAEQGARIRVADRAVA